MAPAPPEPRGTTDVGLMAAGCIAVVGCLVFILGVAGLVYGLIRQAVSGVDEYNFTGGYGAVGTVVIMLLGGLVGFPALIVFVRRRRRGRQDPPADSSNTSL